MSSYEYAYKIWKERPPGPEQLMLEEMFTNGSITASATPESVRQTNEAFKAFTSKVFAAHFRKTKARLGEYVSNAKLPGFLGGVIPPSVAKNENTGSGCCSITELGSNSTIPTAKRPRSNNSGVVEILNPPYTTWIYTDHELKNDFVCVAITIFTGSKEMSFDISEDGWKVIAKFLWPSPMHNPAQMFRQLIRDKTVSTHHPMIHAMASNLLDNGITENSKPEGQWIIPLPLQVRREVSSYTMTKVTYDTSTIMLLKFTAYQNDVIIEQANRTMKF